MIKDYQPISYENRRLPFIQRLLISVSIITIVTLLLILLWQIIDVIMLVFAGIIFAIFLDGLSHWLSQHTPLSRKFALAIVIIGLLIGGGVGIWFAAPPLLNQVSALQQSLIQAVERLSNWLSQYAWGKALINQTPSSLNSVMSVNVNTLSRVTGIFSRTLGGFADVAIFIFVGLYFAVNPQLYKQGFLKLIPPPHRLRFKAILSQIGNTLWWWLIGRFLSMAVIGVLATLGLWLLGVPLAIILGIITGLLTFIPIIGSFLALVPLVLITLPDSLQLTLYVIILYAAIQFVESYFITPFMQKRTTAIPPVVTLLSQVIIGVLIGSIGVILGPPLAAVIMVLVKMLYIEDVLGEKQLQAN